MSALFAVPVVMAALLLSGCDQIGMQRSGGSPVIAPSSTPSTETSPVSTDKAAVPDVNFVRAVAAKVKPAVVTVHILSTIERQPMSIQDMLGGRGGTETRRGAGSGIIISPDGYIITNNHVVAGAERVTIEVQGTGYDARVIGTDALSDIAVVKISPPEGTSLPVAELGNSDEVQVGDWAIAVGNPLDIGATVTLGIVSAIGARGPHLQGDPASSVLQTDAAINPGNSGGALADSNGKVIGVNEAILSPTGTFIGIGFAIPINAANKIAKQLIENGRIIRPYLGISYVPLKSLAPTVRTRLGISPELTIGIVIGQVSPNTPAAAAGLRSGDVISEADGQTIGDEATLNSIISTHKVGDTLRLKVQRADQSKSLSVILRERPISF